MIRWLSDTFGVAPQLMPDDIPALAQDGVTLIICNRPDAEVPPDLSSEALQAAAEAAGLVFRFNPLASGMPSAEQVQAQHVGTDRTVAYCASGTRSTVLWALAQAPDQDVDDILTRCNEAGYPMESLRSIIERGGI